MQVFQAAFRAGDLPNFASAPAHLKAQLVLIFGSTEMLDDAANFHAIRAAFPSAIIAGCSTAGEIHGATVSDGSLIVTAVTFSCTAVQLTDVKIDEASQSFVCGQLLVEALRKNDLKHVLIFSDGLRVNGSELVRGVKDKLPPHVGITGGLSGDGTKFRRTLVCANDLPAEGRIAAIGMYGEKIRVGYGSESGWDSFGPEREITRSVGNVLFDLDRKPALQLYKQYLGERADQLPASALLFPLSLQHRDESDRPINGNNDLVRTILGINEADQSMTFAGDMPEGCHVRLMKANFDGLVVGASGAARTSMGTLQRNSAQLALLISCVGRKLALKQRVDEEIEEVREVLGDKTVLSGFYSYGEISPHRIGGACELHNQTMTITTFSES